METVNGDWEWRLGMETGNGDWEWTVNGDCEWRLGMETGNGDWVSVPVNGDWEWSLEMRLTLPKVLHCTDEGQNVVLPLDPVSVEVLVDPVEDSAGELVLLPHPRVELEGQVFHQPLPLLEGSVCVWGGGGDECVWGECVYGGRDECTCGVEMNTRGGEGVCREYGWWGGMSARVGWMSVWVGRVRGGEE